MSISSQSSRRISGAGLPEGQVISTYTRYLEAQKAVDHLSDEQFDVSTLAIVGHDLATLEQVTGRLTYPRVALMAAGQGAFFGLFFGLILTMFGGGGVTAILLTMALGAAFWMLLGVITFAAQRGRRDFTSLSTIVATRYDVMARDEVAGQARQVLQTAGLLGAAPRSAQGGSADQGPVAGDPAPEPRAPLSKPDELPDGRPSYGVRVAPQDRPGAPEQTGQAGQAEYGGQAEQTGQGAQQPQDPARPGPGQQGPWSGQGPRS